MSNKGYNAVAQHPRNQGKFVSKGDEPMKSMTIRLPIHVFEWIENEAEKRGSTKTDIAREIFQRQISLCE